MKIGFTIRTPKNGKSIIVHDKSVPFGEQRAKLLSTKDTGDDELFLCVPVKRLGPAKTYEKQDEAKAKAKHETKEKK